MADTLLPGISFSTPRNVALPAAASTAEPGMFGALLQALMGGEGKALPQDAAILAADLLAAVPAGTPQAETPQAWPGSSPDAPVDDAPAKTGPPTGPDVAVALPFALPSALPMDPRQQQILKQASGGPAPPPDDLLLPTKEGVIPAGLAAARQFLPAVPAESGGPLSTGTAPVATQEEPMSPEALLRGHPVQLAERQVQAATRETLPLHLPVRAPGWDGELGQRIVWMTGRQMQWAELTLNPPHLGNVEVRLSLSGNEAGAHFFAAQPSVREAIEAALPRLREMLAEAGLSLGQTQVSAESFGGRSAEDNRGEAGHAVGAGEPNGGTDGIPIRRTVLGLVDLYV